MQDNTQPLLTIYIPTYNRAKQLSRQLASLIDAKLDQLNNIEILVANNQSPDDTLIVCQRYSTLMQNFKYITHSKHLPCAEENINASIPFWNGEFVWVLGDDDIINVNTIYEALKLLEIGQYDYYLFNYCFENSNDLVINTLTEFQPYSIKQLVNLSGMMTTCACISITIFKNKLYKDFSDIINISAIYSHVIANLKNFKNCKATFVNMPLISYHEYESESANNNFTKHAKKYQHRLEYPWTDGLTKLFIYSIKHQLITTQDIMSTQESGSRSNFYLFIELLLFYLKGYLRQITENSMDKFDSLGDLLEICKNNMFCYQYVKKIELMQPVVLSSSYKKINASHNNLPSCNKLKQLIENDINKLSRLSTCNPNSAVLVKTGKYFSIFKLNSNSNSNSNSKFYFIRKLDNTEHLRTEINTKKTYQDKVIPAGSICKILVWVTPKNSTCNHIDTAYNLAIKIKQKNIKTRLKAKMIRFKQYPIRASYETLKFILKNTKKSITA